MHNHNNYDNGKSNNNVTANIKDDKDPWNTKVYQFVQLILDKVENKSIAIDYSITAFVRLYVQKLKHS